MRCNRHANYREMFYLSALVCDSVINLTLNKEVIANRVWHFRSLSPANIIVTAYSYRRRSRNTCPEWGSKDLARRLLAKYSRVSGVVLLHRSIIYRLRNGVTNRTPFDTYMWREWENSVKGERAKHIETIGCLNASNSA